MQKTIVKKDTATNTKKNKFGTAEVAKAVASSKKTFAYFTEHEKLPVTK